MIFDSDNKVIISTLNEAEASAFIKFLQSEILRHKRDIKDAEYLIEVVERQIKEVKMDTSETYKDNIVNPLDPLETIEIIKWYKDPVYIKMCEKADEIREAWKPQVGDVCAQSTRGLTGYKYESFDYYTYTLYSCTDMYDAPLIYLLYDAECPSCDLLMRGIEFKESDRFIWLPTQSQLQEMAGLELQELVEDFYQFAMCSWAAQEDDDVFCKFDRSLSFHYGDIEIASMEQLWLAFVMNEKYDKVWDGEDWVTLSPP